MKEMAAKYGYDISGPATNAQEAIQWTYARLRLLLSLRTVLQCRFGRTSTFHGCVHRT